LDAAGAAAAAGCAGGVVWALTTAVPAMNTAAATVPQIASARFILGIPRAHSVAWESASHPILAQPERAPKWYEVPTSSHCNLREASGVAVCRAAESTSCTLEASQRLRRFTIGISRTKLVAHVARR
jgi:hypothetical protein